MIHQISGFNYKIPDEELNKFIKEYDKIHEDLLKLKDSGNPILKSMFFSDFMASYAKDNWKQYIINE